MIRTIPAASIPPDTMVRVEVEGEAILIANIEGKYYAVADTCSHADASLADGILNGAEVMCPLHGARFDLRTGRALSFPAVSPLDTYEVEERDGYLYLSSPLF